LPASKRLVIDTDITSAAGDERSKDIEAKTCHDLLEKVRETEHLFVITTDIWIEWKKHRSGFAQDWLQTMFARKLVVKLGDVRNEALKDKILHFVQGQKAKDATEKDIHLLEAAIATDRLLISKNRKDMERFIAIADRVGEIQAIVWVNPMNEKDSSLEWLENGCTSERWRQLGYKDDSN